MGHSESFNIEIRQGYVRVSGELDMKTAPLIVDAVMAIRDPVSVDLSDVTFMDSHGLQSLLEMRSTRPNLRIVAVSQRVARVLAITETTFLLRPLIKPDALTPTATANGRAEPADVLERST